MDWFSHPFHPCSSSLVIARVSIAWLVSCPEGIKHGNTEKSADFQTNRRIFSKNSYESDYRFQISNRGNQHEVSARKGNCRFIRSPFFTKPCPRRLRSGDDGVCFDKSRGQCGEAFGRGSCRSNEATWSGCKSSTCLHRQKRMGNVSGIANRISSREDLTTRLSIANTFPDSKRSQLFRDCPSSSPGPSNIKHSP